MKSRLLTALLLASFTTSVALAEEAIEASMKYTHKAPQGQKKVSDKILDGTASEEELTKTLELYKVAVNAKPPKGEQAAYHEKFVKLIAATEDVVAKKEGATAAYKAAVNCKACHSEHKAD